MERKWKITSDSVISNDGEEIKFTDERAFPIFVTKQFGVLCGNNGNVHANLLKGDLSTLATQKAVRLMTQMPNFIEEYMPDVDFSDCKTRFDKAKKCAEVIKDDIYCEGRVFELPEETVIMLWKDLPEETKEEIGRCVCNDKEIENTNVVFASNKEEPQSKIGSPDSVVVDGKTYGYNDENSIPFIVFDDNKIIYGGCNDVHALLLSKLKKQMREKCFATSKLERTPETMKMLNAALDKKLDDTAVVEGRVWNLMDECDKVVFAFWTEYKAYDIKEVIEKVCNRLGFDLEKAYVYRNRDLIHVSEEDYIPTDSDYANMETDFDSESYQNELDALHQIHNPEYTPTNKEDRTSFEKRKKDNTAYFRQNRDEKNQVELWDTDSSGLEAGYRFHNSMDENKKES